MKKLSWVLSDAARHAYDTARQVQRSLSPDHRKAHRQNERERRIAEEQLASFSLGGEPVTSGKVFIDAMWYNANHWLRFAIVRKALGLSKSEEIAVTGQYDAKRATQSLKRFGIEHVVDFHALAKSSAQIKRQVQDALASLNAPEDIIQYPWPLGTPGPLVYDFILRKQRQGVLDLSDPRLGEHLSWVFRYAQAAERLFAEHDFQLVVLSEIGANSQIAIACYCLQHNIPVIVVRAVKGYMRILRIRDIDHLRFVTNRPQPSDMDALNAAQLDTLRDLGRAEMAGRLSGLALDPGAAKTYANDKAHVTRQDICAHYNWPVDRPMVAVYAPNWYDRPHAFGMQNFRDYVDWMQCILETAQQNDRVSWLIKEHPSDDLYAGIRLSDLMANTQAPNIQISNPDWYGGDVMQAVNGIITYHGTIGIESSVFGPPVLVPDRGFYDDLGFVVKAKSRAHFIELLHTPWWEDVDMKDIRDRAMAYAGMQFCGPAWQGVFRYPNDFTQDRANREIPGFLQNHMAAIEREAETVRTWFFTDEITYHPYKMRQWLAENQKESPSP